MLIANLGIGSTFGTRRRRLRRRDLHSVGFFSLRRTWYPTLPVLNESEGLVIDKLKLRPFPQRVIYHCNRIALLKKKKITRYTAIVYWEDIHVLRTTRLSVP